MREKTGGLFCLVFYGVVSDNKLFDSILFGAGQDIFVSFLSDDWKSLQKILPQENTWNLI